MYSIYKQYQIKIHPGNFASPSSVTAAFCTQKGETCNQLLYSYFLSFFSLIATDEDDIMKSKKTFRSQAVVNQNTETELMLEGDDDAISLLQEKEIDNLAGNCHTRSFRLIPQEV